MKVCKKGFDRIIICLTCNAKVKVFPKDLRKAKWCLRNDYSLVCPVCKTAGLIWRNYD